MHAHASWRCKQTCTGESSWLASNHGKTPCGDMSNVVLEDFLSIRMFESTLIGVLHIMGPGGPQGDITQSPGTSSRGSRPEPSAHRSEPLLQTSKRALGWTHKNPHVNAAQYVRRIWRPVEANISSKRRNRTSRASSISSIRTDPFFVLEIYSKGTRAGSRYKLRKHRKPTHPPAPRLGCHVVKF